MKRLDFIIKGIRFLTQQNEKGFIAKLLYYQAKRKTKTKINEMFMQRNDQTPAWRRISWTSPTRTVQEKIDDFKILSE